MGIQLVHIFNSPPKKLLHTVQYIYTYIFRRKQLLLLPQLLYIFHSHRTMANYMFVFSNHHDGTPRQPSLPLRCPQRCLSGSNRWVVCWQDAGEVVCLDVCSLRPHRYGACLRLVCQWEPLHLTTLPSLPFRVIIQACRISWMTIFQASNKRSYPLKQRARYTVNRRRRVGRVIGWMLMVKSTDYPLGKRYISPPRLGEHAHKQAPSMQMVQERANRCAFFRPGVFLATLIRELIISRVHRNFELQTLRGLKDSWSRGYRGISLRLERSGVGVIPTATAEKQITRVKDRLLVNLYV